MASQPGLEPHVQILGSLVPQARQLSIHACEGEVLASRPGMPSAGLCSAVESVAQALARHASGRFADVRLLVEGAATYVLCVRDAADKPVAFVCLQCAPADSLAEAPDTDAMLTPCAPVFALLSREIPALLRRQRSGGDTTLHRRWAADVAENAAEHVQTGLISQAMLESLVQRSNAAGALLYLPAAGHEVMAAPPGSASADLEQLRRVCLQHLFPGVSKSGAPMIVNKLREAANTDLVPWRILCVPLLRGTLVVGIVAVFRRRQADSFAAQDETLLRRLADGLYATVEAAYDEATGLLTRQAFEDNALRRLDADPRRPRCVVYGDMDRLHMINDLFGFARGDAILHSVAAIWHRSALPAGSLVSRLSGDRFVGLLDGFTLNQARSWAEKLRTRICAITPPQECAGVDVSASFGIAALSADHTLNHALAASETACKAAKDRGRNRVEVFADTDESLMQRHEDLRVFRDLVDALDTDRFVLFAQPLRPLTDPTRPTHYEILVRMRDVSGSLVLPGKFLSAATRYQLFTRMDQWVIQHTLDALKPHREFLRSTATMFWINLSGQSLAQPEFADYVRAAVREADLPAGSVGFEITENAAIGNLETAQRFMSRLRELGCSFALDDFGTGLSSLKYLKDLKVSMLKIDGSFIRDLLRDPRSDSLVRAVLRVAEELGLETTAECIESPETAVHLSGIGVTYGQGFELGRPGDLAMLLGQLAGAGATQDAPDATLRTPPGDASKAAASG